MDATETVLRALPYCVSDCLRRFFVLALVSGLVTACSSQLPEIEAPISERPLVKPLDLYVALDFYAFEVLDKSDDRKKALSRPSREMIRTIFSGVFKRVAEIDVHTDRQSNLKKFDVLVFPEIISATDHEITYEFEFLMRNGQEKYFRVSGKDFSDEKMDSEARVRNAMRNAGANFIFEFYSSPSLRRWFPS